MAKWFILFLSVLVISCAEQREEIKKNQTDFPYAFNYSKFEGIYEGDFGGSSIRIVLKHVSGKHATGYNLHQGLRRNISGKMSFSDGAFQFLLNEPGDHKYDGAFQFTIDTIKYELKGTWKPLNNDSFQSKTFVLDKKTQEEFQVFSDSAAIIYFHEDGLCRYEFYPIIDQKLAEQMIQVTGTWTQKANEFIVDWEPNDLFPDRRSVLIAHEDSTIPGFFSYIQVAERTLYVQF